MIFEPESVKGFKDYLPPKSLVREKIADVSKKYFKLYGFLPTETPVIEFDELMRSDELDGEDEAISDRFRLKDRGGRNLGLRYEFTFQLSRLFKQNPNIKLPLKRYQIGSNFRDEPIRTGRTRQFTQCDIDIIGSSEIDSDVECLAVISDIIKELKIKGIEIQVNNRKLVDEIIESVKIRDKKQVMRELDKIEKIGEDNVKVNLKRYANSNQILTLFKMLEKPLAFFKENAFSGADELEMLIKKCRAYGIKVKPNLGMMRGFAYYTGNTFEVMKGKTAIAAGGRYDDLVGKYINRKIPAVGISFSLESFIGLCPELSEMKTEGIKAILISLNQDKETIRLSQMLRKENISCSTSFAKPGKALEYANAYKIPFAVFIGEEEVKKKKYKLKNLESGDEKLLGEKSLVSRLRK